MRIPQLDDRPVSLGVLLALGRTGKHVYGGTVPYKVKMYRRERNRVARQSRKINRSK